MQASKKPSLLWKMYHLMVCFELGYTREIETLGAARAASWSLGTQSTCILKTHSSAACLDAVWKFTEPLDEGEREEKSEAVMTQNPGHIASDTNSNWFWWKGVAYGRQHTDMWISNRANWYRRMSRAKRTPENIFWPNCIVKRFRSIFVPGGWFIKTNIFLP